MSRVLSIHSSRGGTGKSLIAVNLAAIYAKEGINVCIIDLDFRAPSLSTIFDISHIEYSVNDLLNGQCPIENVLIDVSEKYKTKGKFFVGLADPSLEAIRDITSKSRKWEMGALKKLLTIKSSLNDLKVNCIIYDTTPGILYSSINAVASSDVSLIVLTLDDLDITGTQRMIKDIYDAFEKKTFILLNKAPPEKMLKNRENSKRIFYQIESDLNKPLIGNIPCFCDVLEASRSLIFALDRPEHAFTRRLKLVAQKLSEALIA